MSFHVRKWYVDCLDPDGRAAIAYWVSLSWGEVKLTWHSVDLYEPERPPTRNWSLTAVKEPADVGGHVAWRSKPLGCALTLEPRCAEVRALLLDNAEGRVEWRCAVPLASAAFALDGHAPVRGTGYAECLDLTIPPWRLPITELRWGHWGDETRGRSLVWIDWRGSPNRTWAFLDGTAVAGSVVTDQMVAAPAGAILTLARDRTLVRRSFADLVAPIPALRSMLPASLLALSETKWTGVGNLRDNGSAPVSAPALFEVVHLGAEPAQ